MDSTRKTARLGPLESAVMDRLWEEASGMDVAAMHAAVGAPRDLTRNTIHSTLERLVRKGLATRRRRGRAYEYSATASRTAWIAELLDSLVGELGAAERAEVLVGFVDFAERTHGSMLETLEELVRRRLEERDGRDAPGEEA